MSSVSLAGVKYECPGQGVSTLAPLHAMWVPADGQRNIRVPAMQRGLQCVDLSGGADRRSNRCGPRLRGGGAPVTRWQRARAALREQGLCVWCGKDAGGRALCEKCRARKNHRARVAARARPRPHLIPEYPLTAEFPEGRRSPVKAPGPSDFVPRPG